MTTRTKSTSSSTYVTPVYHDFEPFCEWKRGEDLLVVHIPEFKKEQLKVQVSTSGSLKISGERPLEEDKIISKSRFYKEIRVPEGCDINEIQAKLSNGKLAITMPRHNLPPISVPSHQEQGVPVRRTVDPEGKEEEMIGFGKLKFAKKIVVNVGIAIVTIATIGALVFFKPETAAVTTTTTYVGVPSPSPTAFANREK